MRGGLVGSNLLSMRSSHTVNQPKNLLEPGLSSDHDTSTEAVDAGPLLYLAAACSLVGALIHYWLIPEHYAQWWGYGAFFTVAAIAQGFCAGALIFWPRRMVFRAGVAGTVAILLLYVVTRTVGIPFFGPDAGSIEHVESLDLISAAAELTLVVILVAQLRIHQAMPIKAAAALIPSPDHESPALGRPASSHRVRVRRPVTWAR